MNRARSRVSALDFQANSIVYKLGCTLLILLPCSNCDLDRNEGILMAAGSYGDIAVVLSDDDLRPAVQPFLDRLNRPVTFVIREEHPYAIDIFPPNKWKLSQGYKNILFVLRWGDGGAVGKKLNTLMSDQTQQRLKSGQSGFVQIEDPFARYQFALIVAGHDRNSVASILNRNVDKIRGVLEEKIQKRIQRRFRHTGLQEKLMTRYWQHHGFFLEIPLEYRENQVNPEGFQGIEWMRNSPSRGISLAWREVADPKASLTDRELLLDWRQEMGQAMHHEEILDAPMAWSDTELGGQPSVQLSGSWASQVISGGGPFLCFFLADVERGRLFCLDILIFAPGEDKIAYMREMQAIAATFSLQRPHP